MAGPSSKIVPRTRFVPSFVEPKKEEVEKFLRVLRDIDKLVVLTGAGISTESGIPDYRSKDVGLYARKNHKPIFHQDFMKSQAVRQRFWARNYVAWKAFSSAPCNLNHYTIAGWERSDKFHWLITQNVDGLHTLAGSTRVTELHGCGRRVKCMKCGDVTPRDNVQVQMHSLNQTWKWGAAAGEIAPDGDVDLPPESFKTFVPPTCTKCGPDGILKTDVVFFGANVDPKVNEECYEKLDECDGLLVLGSSLEVNTGSRLVHYMKSIKKLPVLIVNIGETKMDEYADVKLSTRCSDIVKLV